MGVSRDRHEANGYLPWCIYIESCGSHGRPREPSVERAKNFQPKGPTPSSIKSQKSRQQQTWSIVKAYNISPGVEGRAHESLQTATSNFLGKKVVDGARYVKAMEYVSGQR